MSAKGADRHDIIVMGASAGGIEVLLRIVESLPGDLPAAIFVVVHRSPGERLLDRVLTRNGSIPALYAEDDLRIRSQRIFVAPPDHHLTLRNGAMHLNVGPRVNRNRPAIDPLFESAAANYGKRVIGVVLSGYLDDGTAGLAAVKRHGGIAVVQDPKDALAANMPRNALMRVNVDYCVRANDIAPLLVELVSTGNNTGRK